ncbi:MAG: alanine--tRNA ligase-related protein [Candidatus Komeilibacteria bacterium]|nr:alanine--tRNA ligase-related protein [Candidatus Komeilibacteria bacterium]
MTKLLYLENFTQLEAEAKVIEIKQEGEKIAVILDQTIFHPQGGGQPYDQGIIESVNGKFAVAEVRMTEEEAVNHFGQFVSGSFKSGEIVNLRVDDNRRQLNSRIHSAGHLLDLAVANLRLDWAPGKGYHFPDGPYVEYVGSLNGVDQEKLKQDLEAECNQIVNQGKIVTVKFVTKVEATEICRIVPDYFPVNKPGRLVMFGSFGVPCGGTHVSDLEEIGPMTVRKIKVEKDRVRVSYDVER